MAGGAEPGAMRDYLGQDRDAVRPRQAGRDSQHGIEGEQLALREGQARREPPQSCVQAGQQEQDEHHVGKQGDRRRVRSEHHPFELDDPETGQGNQQRAEENGPCRDPAPHPAGQGKARRNDAGRRRLRRQLRSRHYPAVLALQSRFLSWPLSAFGGLAVELFEEEKGQPRCHARSSQHKTRRDPRLTVNAGRATNAPPLVVEVSDTTLRFDRTTKAGLYTRAGIREYWVVDIAGRQVFVHRRPTSEVYSDITAYSAEEIISTLARPDASITIADLVPPAQTPDFVFALKPPSFSFGYFQGQLTWLFRLDIRSGKSSIGDKRLGHAVPQVLAGADVIEMLDGQQMQPFFLPVSLDGGIAPERILLPGGEHERAGKGFEQTHQSLLVLFCPGIVVVRMAAHVGRIGIDGIANRCLGKRLLKAGDGKRPVSLHKQLPDRAHMIGDFGDVGL